MSDTTELAVADDVATDDVRTGVVDALSEVLAEGVIESHVIAGVDLWIRVTPDSWVAAHETAKAQGFVFFDFLSAIDWLPSPYGREMDSEVDTLVHGSEPNDPEPMESGFTGGSARLQLLSRVFNIDTNIGITFKCDLDDDAPAIDTIIPVFAGANWHEREVWEMFGIDINGHPDLRALYLPTGFEGNPLRKDFPLLARRVKPWPGIVDVEPMPGDDDEKDATS